MDLIKSIEFFDPFKVTKRCHIIGCGSVGSSVAELLARAGITQISLYDFDYVEARNLANQMFVDTDIGKRKTEALARIITDINPAAKKDLKLFNEGYSAGMKLSGYVFLCVDNIELRHAIATEHKDNQSIVAMFDFRTGLEHAQHYATMWNDLKGVENFIKSMEFTHEEAHEATPVTACNVEMGIAPTVRIICAFGVANFMNMIKGLPLKKILTTNIFNFMVDAI